MQDLHNSLTLVIAVDTQIITGNGATIGNIIDRAGQESLEFMQQVGTIIDGQFDACLIEHGDDSGLSDAAPVPDDELLGLEADMTFIVTEDDVAKSIGYVGDKQFVRITLNQSASTTGATTGVVALMSVPIHRDEPV